MKWEESASLLLEKVPPFVQKTVREKVETLARQRGKTLVTEAEVLAARGEFMEKQQQQRPVAKQHAQNEKLSIIRKYTKYFDKDGNRFCIISA
ncbi:MAG: asrC 1 [Candidatus Brocadiaceae bacterium]|nr:asrC 1 [Candidatus Brocadiaceae bacterium]